MTSGTKISWCHWHFHSWSAEPQRAGWIQLSDIGGGHFGLRSPMFEIPGTVQVSSPMGFLRSNRSSNSPATMSEYLSRGPTRGRGISMSIRRSRSLEEASGWVGRTCGRSSRPADDDLSSGVALFQVRDCCGYFGERIAPVDVGPHFAGFNQVGKELQLRGGYLR